MHARVKISEKVEDLDVTISLTMKLSEWRKVMRQLPSDWPSWEVARMISASVGEIARATDRLVSDPEIQN